MKKHILLFFMFLLMLPIFAEPLVGFSGIKFGTSRKIAKEEFEKQGWMSFYSASDDIDSYIGLQSEGLTLEGVSITKIDTSFDYNDNFFAIRFYLDASLSEDGFDQLLSKLEQKYGMEYLGILEGGIFHQTNNGNLIMVTLGTQKNLLTQSVERIYVIEMLDTNLQRNNYNHNHR